jgi:hypothetical protein
MGYFYSQDAGMVENHRFLLHEQQHHRGASAMALQWQL